MNDSAKNDESPASTAPVTSAAERAKRKRRRAAIRREAETRIADLQRVSEGRGIHSPRVLFAAFIILAAVGAVLLKRVNTAVEDERPFPHYSAIRSLNVLATALGRYRFHVGTFPSTEQGLKALIEDPGEEGWLGPYIIQLKPDPWDSPYAYRLGTNGMADVYTIGPDRKAGTPDDLRPDPDSYEPGTDWTNGWLKVEDRLPDIEKILR